MQQVKKAVILAAGYGTRFLPFTKAISKVMLPIIDKPTIELICEELKNSGIEEILIVVGSNKENIIKHFGKNAELENVLKKKPDFLPMVKQYERMKVSFVEQTNIDGSAGACMLAKNFTKNEPFLLAYADDLMKKTGELEVSKQLINEYEKTGKTILGVQNVAKEDIVKYSSI